ncbi:MAG: histidine phosphatase family protein [Planctomycetota bacterium]
MKTLLLLRHAKSSWNDPLLADHDRPLKKRGRKTAPRMGRWLIANGLRPDHALCSTATRARETLQLLLAEVDKSVPVSLHAELYHGDVAQMIGALREVAEPAASVLIVGHNPDLELFLEHLTGQSERLPTAALARVELDLSDWSELTDATRGMLVSVSRPRELARD